MKLCVAKAGDLGLASEKEAWCVDLLTLSDKYLSKVILQEDGKFKTVSNLDWVFFFFIPDRSLSTQTAAHVSRSLKPLILGSALVGYGVYKYMNTEQTVGLFPAVSAAGVPESQPSVSLRKRVFANLFNVFSEIEL